LLSPGLTSLTLPGAQRQSAPRATNERFSEGQDRWNRGACLFRDSTPLEILLDEAFHIPGAGIRFGLDGIFGLIPGLSDVLAGLLSLVIPPAARMRGVPYGAPVRMAANLGIGFGVAPCPSSATSSKSPGRPTAATNFCSAVT
jgi:hypothetical protein